MDVGGATTTAVSTRPWGAMSYAAMAATTQIQGTTFAITHASRAAEVLRGNQEQLKARVSAALGNAPVQWSDARSPCLKDLGLLVPHLQGLETTRREAILFDQTQATAQRAGKALSWSSRIHMRLVSQTWRLSLRGTCSRRD